MIGPEHKSTVVQAILGPEHSPLLPDQLWLGFLDEEGQLLDPPTTVVDQDVWTPVEGGVGNGEPIDAGAAPDEWEIHAVGLFDAPDGALVITAVFPEPVQKGEGEPLLFDTLGLTFTIEDPS